mmetsp:Transcript_20710/g.38531  ORF Transcript_20710/g.38531 Transcript_20710/m.38531 type:complete len:297 (+) Transcript_20710:30-920(+)
MLHHSSSSESRPVELDGPGSGGTSGHRQNGDGDQDDGVVIRAAGSAWFQLRSIFVISRWQNPTATEARLLSWISVALTLVTAVVGVVLAIHNYSAALLAFALEGLVDVASSLLVIWRFTSTTKGLVQDRENRASAGIGFAFILLGSIVGGTALNHLITGSAVDDSRALLGITIPSCIYLIILATLKFHVASVLKSASMFEDAVCTLGSLLLSIGVIVGIAMYRSNSKFWYIDSLFAVIVSVVLFIYGLKVVRRYPWKTKSFWFGKQSENLDGDDDDYLDDNVGSGETRKTVDIDMV